MWPEGIEVVVTARVRHQNPLFAPSEKFGIHENSRYPAVAVVERMNFSNQEHEVDCARQRLDKDVANLETFAQCSFDESPVNETSRSGPVVLTLECSRADLWSRSQQSSMA